MLVAGDICAIELREVLCCSTLDYHIKNVMSR